MWLFGAGLDKGAEQEGAEWRARRWSRWARQEAKASREARVEIRRQGVACNRPRIFRIIINI